MENVPAPTRPTPSSAETHTIHAQRRRAAPLISLASILLVVVLFAAGCSVDTTGNTTGNNSGSQLGGSQTIDVPPAATDLQQTIIKVIAAVQPSVVEVQSSGGGGGGAIGSGEVITADGYIVTNDHVVRGFSSFTVALANGRQLP